MRSIALALLFCSLNPGWAAEAPAFEVASIKPHDPSVPPPGHGSVPDYVKAGGRFEANGLTVQMLLEWAYTIQPQQHSKLQPWMERERYDIAATASSSRAAEAEMKRMTRQLLADRFGLKIHHEERTLPALVLSVGKTPPKLTPARENGTRGLQPQPMLGPNQEAMDSATRRQRLSAAGAGARGGRGPGDLQVATGR